MANVYDVANFFVDIANKSTDDSMSNLKVNKLIYFAQGVYLARTGKTLFDDKIEAWDYGPVVSCIYHKYSPCGKGPIQSEEHFSSDVFTSSEIEVLIDVMREMGKYTGNNLIDITHKEGTPWKMVYKQGENAVIDNELIKQYFIDHPIKRFNCSDKIKKVNFFPKEWDSQEEDKFWEKCHDEN